MAFTGLFWCGFLVAHLAGNFLLFGGERVFMNYAEAITANKAILYSMEVLMVVVLLVHVGTALRVTGENKTARGSQYAYSGPPVDASLASRTMLQTGLVIFAFLILHIWTIKFDVRPDENLYFTVVRRFSNWGYSLFYIFAMCLVGMHVSHGLQSAFQTLGLNHEKYTPCIKNLSRLFGLVIAGGFSSIALYFLMRGGEL